MFPFFKSFLSHLPLFPQKTLSLSTAINDDYFHVEHSLFDSPKHSVGIDTFVNQASKDIQRTLRRNTWQSYVIGGGIGFALGVGLKYWTQAKVKNTLAYWEISGSLIGILVATKSQKRYRQAMCCARHKLLMLQEEDKTHTSNLKEVLQYLQVDRLETTPHLPLIVALANMNEGECADFKGYCQLLSEIYDLQHSKENLCHYYITVAKLAQMSVGQRKLKVQQVLDIQAMQSQEKLYVSELADAKRDHAF